MKIKFLLLGTIVLAAAAFLSLQNSQNDIACDYAPRESQMKAGDAQGMQWIYDQLRKNLETGQQEPGDYMSMRNAVEEHNRNTKGERALDLSWIEMGPDNIGGRTRSLLIVDENTVFAGSVSGGLWKSVNGGNTWSKVSTLPACVIGSIAMTGNGDIYVGTGNQFESGSSGNGSSGFLGSGLWRSTDGGGSWAVVPGTQPSVLNSSSNWNAINTLEGDGNDNDRVWIGGDAGFGYYDSGDNALVMNSQNGVPPGDCQDIDISADGEVFLIAIGAGRVCRSSDGGNNFVVEAGGDLPNTMGRARVSVSDIDSDHCFVLYTASNGSMGGVWYSSNKGDNWNEVWPGGIDEYDPMGTNTQGYYDLALINHPTDPESAIVGGVTLWKVTSAGQPEQIAFNFGFGGFELYVHSDIHEFVNAPNGDLYIGCDGGVFKSTTGGQTFYAANRGYNVTQYYGIGYSSGSPVIGGTQDNGTHVIFADGSLSTEQEAIEVFGGDGFDCDISQATAGGNVVAFATSQNGHLGRFDSQGGGGQFYDDELLELVDPMTGDIGGFYTTIRSFEDTEDEDSQQIITIINPEDSNIYAPYELTLFTNNLNIPFTYTFEEGDTLHYWEEIVRPSFTSTELLEFDPTYWWLDAQDIESTFEDCVTDSMITDTTIVIDQIIEETLTVYWQDTIYVDDMPIIIYDSTLVVIGIDTTFMQQINYSYTEECTTYYTYAADVLESVREHKTMIDNYTAMFTIGFSGSDGIWLTREALNMNTTPDWWKIVQSAPSSGVKAQEYSMDGNHYFYSSWGGQLFRVSNLDQLWSAEDVSLLTNTTIISQAGGTVTGIAPDPNNPEHVVVTVGGYGTVGNGKVRETWNALDATPVWDNIWFASGDMARMPCYDVVVDVSDETGKTIIVGTEFGIYTTNTGGGTDGSDWTQQNDPQDIAQSTGIDACPVFTVRQQQIATDKRFRAPVNKGVIYAGTHGRGIFRSETLGFVGIDNPEEIAANTGSGNLLVYPNPTAENAFVNLSLGQSTEVQIRIFGLNGQLVKQLEGMNYGQGEHKIQLDIAGLTNGTYLVYIDAGAASGVGKFVVLN
jgi:hypothetical protein